MRNMETVKLNVGGRRFEVSSSLLETQPNSHLAKLITDKNEDAVDEIFIDRDGDIFQHVLQYLRNGKVSLPSVVTIDSFIAEMEFFKLEFERSNILPDGSKNDTNTKEDERASSPKPIFEASCPSFSAVALKLLA